MTLLDRQIAFRAELVAPDDDSPPSSTGMAIYRDAYRGRLLAAIESGFERTRRWAGEDAFTAAACHYVLSHPPVGWTLDSYAAEFPALLAELFAGDPEVAELAWLEWHLQQAFAAPDRPQLDPAELASAGYGEADWGRMRFTLAAGFAARPITTDCGALWESLEDAVPTGFTVATVPEAALVVWRSGFSPSYRRLDRAEAAALVALADGARFGEVAADCDPALLGGWLAQWLGEGLIAAAQPD